MSSGTHETGPVGSGSGPFVDDLACEIEDYSVALPRGPYREQLHAMLVELVEFHRADLDEAVMPLVVETLRAIDPAASPSSATLVDLETRWQAPLQGFPARTYNALSLCRVLGDIREDFESGRPWMGRHLNYAIVGDDIRPLTPSEAMGKWNEEWAPKIADLNAPEIRMLRRFIASALQALKDAGIPRPEPGWVALYRELGLPDMKVFRRSYGDASDDPPAAPAGLS
jgi:hypothetical protein